MGVRPALPDDGVTLILGNDESGGSVCLISSHNGRDENEKQFLGEFKVL